MSETFLNKAQLTGLGRDARRTEILRAKGIAELDARLVIAEATIEPTAWTNVTFTNSWVNFGGSAQAVQYRKVGDVVYLRGIMKSGTLGSAAFTLPTGFRPPAQIEPTINTFNAAPLVGALAINGSGVCTPFAPDNVALDLSTVFFSVTA